MGKHTVTKRLSSLSQSTSKSIDIKARKRIEELYEVTDEIINAYNDINEKYVYQIYRKYKQLQETNKQLKKKLDDHHCSGCKCSVQSKNDEEEQSDHSVEDEIDDNDEQTKTSTLPSSTTESSITRTKKKNPFIISDIEDTQNFDNDDDDGDRFNQNGSDNDEDNAPMDTNQKQTNNDSESDEESDEEVDENNNEEDNGMERLPLTLRDIIRRKAERNKKEKKYLLYIPQYPALCEYLRDRSETNFNRKPSDDQVRPLIIKYISPQAANDKKVRQRVQHELREIHRSYYRIYKTDPYAQILKPHAIKSKQLKVKKSPM